MKPLLGLATLLVAVSAFGACASSEDDPSAGSGGQAGASGSGGVDAGGSGGASAGAGGGGAGGATAECVTDAECPAPAAECEVAECVSSKCVTKNRPAGEKTTTQTVGDCRENQCNGQGGFTVVFDDADLPVDGKPCTDDLCTAGVPSNPPKAVGTSCNNGLTCDANGDCIGCIAPSLCPGVDTECATRTCTAGTCGFAYAAAGTPTSSQTLGDCKLNQCDGVGNVVSVVNDTDLPVDGKACTEDKCTAGVASNPIKAAGTPCAAGLTCDTKGDCVGCTAPSGCPGVDTECATRTCTAGACGFSYVNAGTPTASQISGDCKVNQCDGAGNVVSVSSTTDLPVDGKQCTSDLCTGGVPSNPPLAAGSACNEAGGKLCTSAAVCVECLTSADCTSGTCQTNQCVTTGCAPNTSDCDGSSSNGCECSGNFCCGGGCAPAHHNGLGQPFDSCDPLGVPGTASTYSLGLASAARAAWPFAGTDGSCGCVPGNMACVFRQTATSCAVWIYEKSLAGSVHLNTANNTCLCPSASSPTWQ